MTTDDTGSDTQPRPLWWLLPSILIVAGAGYFAVVKGVTALPPFIALLLVGATATVVYRLLERLRGVFDNVAVAALSAIALMVSMLSGVILIGLVLWMIVMLDPNPLEQMLAAKDPYETAYRAFMLFIYVSLGVLGLVHTATLWLMVRSNAFGAKRTH